MSGQNFAAAPGAQGAGEAIAAGGAGRAGPVDAPVLPQVHRAKINWARLSVALALSCAVHAVPLLVPHLGRSTAASGGGVRGVPQVAGARLLQATLLRERPQAAEPQPAVVASPVAAAAAPLPLPATPPATKKESGSAAASTLGAGLLPLAAPAFHTADQLTHRPQPLTPPNLEELAATNPSLLGIVILKLWIGDDGRVVSTEIEESQIPAAAAAAAAAAFAKLRFAPGQINGRAVGAIMRIEVSYEASAPELPPALPAAQSP